MEDNNNQDQNDQDIYLNGMNKSLGTNQEIDIQLSDNFVSSNALVLHQDENYESADYGDSLLLLFNEDNAVVRDPPEEVLVNVPHAAVPEIVQQAPVIYPAVPAVAAIPEEEEQVLVHGPVPVVNVVQQLQELLGIAAAAVPVGNEGVLMNGPPPRGHAHVLEAFEIYGPQPVPEAILQLQELLGNDPAAAAAVPEGGEGPLMDGPPPPGHVHVLEAFEIFGPLPADNNPEAPQQHIAHVLAVNEPAAAPQVVEANDPADLGIGP